MTYIQKSPLPKIQNRELLPVFSLQASNPRILMWPLLDHNLSFIQPPPAVCHSFSPFITFIHSKSISREPTTCPAIWSRERENGESLPSEDSWSSRKTNLRTKEDSAVLEVVWFGGPVEGTANSPGGSGAISDCVTFEGHIHSKQWTQTQVDWVSKSIPETAPGQWNRAEEQDSWPGNWV